MYDNYKEAYILSCLKSHVTQSIDTIV